MLAHRFDKSGKINLRDIPTDSDGGMTKDEGKVRLAPLCSELEDLQELLYAAGQNGLLVVLQGRDTAGKDGTLRDVAGCMNSVGTNVASFKVPTALEASHDFLWRVHKEAPGRSQVTWFNRSHYEDVLVARVHKLVSEKVWKARYDRINEWEELLTDAGIIVVKFCLHISKDEQKARLLAREEDPAKAWKLSVGDWEERNFWDNYTDAYNDAVGKCSAPNAPWYVVPADHKWFRNLAIAEALVETLRPYRKNWEEKLAEIGKTQKAALAQMRAKDTKAAASVKTSKSGKK